MKIANALIGAGIAALILTEVANAINLTGAAGTLLGMAPLIIVAFALQKGTKSEF